MAAVPSFFFIRHGETAWNVEGRLQGQRDIPLNPIGRDQAASAGRTLKRLLVRRGLSDAASLRFIASPLGRARDTMEIARRAMGLDPSDYLLDERLKELSFGSWEGLTWGELKLRDRPAVLERKRDKWHFVPPGGESYAGLVARLTPWVAGLQPDDIVVAHGGVARALMVLLGAVPSTIAPDIDIQQGRVLTFAEGRYRWD